VGPMMRLSAGKTSGESFGTWMGDHLEIPGAVSFLAALRFHIRDHRALKFSSHAAIPGAQTACRRVLHGLVRGGVFKSGPTGPPGGAGSMSGIRECSIFFKSCCHTGTQTACRCVLLGLGRGGVLKTGPTGPPGGAGSERRSSGGCWPGRECVFLGRRVGGCHPGCGRSCREGERLCR